MKQYSHDLLYKDPTSTAGGCPKSFYDSMTSYQQTTEESQKARLDELMIKWVETAAPRPVEPKIPENSVSELIVPCDNQPAWGHSRKSGAIVLGSYTRVKDSREYFAARMPVEQRSGQSFGASAYVSTCGGLYRPVASVVGSDVGWEWATPPSETVLANLIRDASAQIPPNLQEIAWTNALANANAAVYDLATDLAEIRETVGFLREALPSIRRSLSTLRESAVRIRDPRRAFRRARQILKENGGDIRELRFVRHFKEVADYWLAARYGVIPLMLSVRDAIEAITSDRKIYVTARGNDTLEHEGVSASGRYECEVSMTVKGRGYIKSQWTKAGLRRVSLYVPTAMWEIVPYSFIIDWFVNVGDFVAALRPFDGVARNGTVSLHLQKEVKVFYTREAVTGSDPDPYPSGSWTRWQRQERSAERVLVFHQTLDSYRRSLPRNFGPTLGTTSAPLSLLRRIDSLALGFQKLKIRKL